MRLSISTQNIRKVVMKSSQLSFYLHHIFMDVEVKIHVHFCYIDINSLLPNIQFDKTNYY